jgi:hypothetical protein
MFRCDFLTRRSLLSTRQPLSSTVLFERTAELSIAGKYFQIEEMEDRDSCTTEVKLNVDHTVELLQTNGPLFKSGEGSWGQDGGGGFSMSLRRTFEAGQKNQRADSTALGQFEYTTERRFTGQMSKIGDKIGVEGSIHDIGLNGEERVVGFFEMIDTTVGEDGEVGLKGAVRSS